jgi:uncharacterized membrane protein
MAFCANCGAEMTGNFCPKCGAEAPSQQQQYQAPTGSPAAGAGLTTNAASALCYLLGFITGIIFLVLSPYNQNREVRFHAFQSIFLSVGIFVVFFALGIISTMMFAISTVFWGLFSVIYLALNVGVFVLWIYMMWQTYQGKRIVLPVIGPLAEKQA